MLCHMAVGSAPSTVGGGTAAAPRGFEIAPADHGKIRSHHPKEAWHGPSQPTRQPRRAGLTAQGLARVHPPAQPPRAPGSPWWPRSGSLLTVPNSRGQLGRTLPPSPPPPAHPCPRNQSCRRLGRGTPPQTVFLGPTSEAVRRTGWKVPAEMSAPSRPIRRTRLIALAMLPAPTAQLYLIKPFGLALQMENGGRARLPLNT